SRFLSQGYDVVATDPAENAEARMRESIENAWPALEKQGLAEGASKDRLTFEPDLAKAISNADLIQENVPEREELKRMVLAEIDRLSKPEAIIASSTSGLKPSTLQEDCQRPERVIVAHPFNPVYLIPLVELVGGKDTSPEIIEISERFYESIKMKPLVISTEVEGHVADRLMEAIWREALHLVNDG
ncbi:L-carnitine dehydrogenase, partial [Bacillus haikouensis]|uniref:3-hydroxyacyl-CoA dehydrogenase NAD-binding domain-containing protein n=1 Tax=Bacillus haikouensis TaxID=1510468 RepID=UPI001FE97C11